VKKKAIIFVFALILFFQFLTVTKALPGSTVIKLWLPRPPVFSSDEPAAIPDNPFLESLTPKQIDYLLAHMLVAEAFCSGPGNCNWNPRADLNLDGSINIYDAIIVAKNC
jgi:hypothetical protein